MEIEKQFSDKALADFQLVDRACSNDQRAFAELMKKYKKSVYHVILKMVKDPDDSEDLMMEVFAKAFKNLHKFQKDFAFTTWLFRIATNHTIDFLRKKRLQTLSISPAFVNHDGDTTSLDISGSNLNPQESVINDEKIKIMRRFVGELPEKYKTLVELRYFDELSYEEIRQEIGAPLGTVKAQLHRSREILYEMVESSLEAI